MNELTKTSGQNVPHQLGRFAECRRINAPTLKKHLPKYRLVSATHLYLGIPDKGDFAAILSDPRKNPEHTCGLMPSCWRQVQTLLQCLEKARVILHSELSQADRNLTRTGHCDDIENTLLRLASESQGPLRVALLPQGPLSVPTLV